MAFNYAIGVHLRYGRYTAPGAILSNISTTLDAPFCIRSPPLRVAWNVRPRMAVIRRRSRKDRIREERP